MKKISPLFLLALSMSCTTPGMQQALDEDVAEKFADKLNPHEVALARAIYDNDVQKAEEIAHSPSEREAIVIDKNIDLRRFYSNRNKRFSFLLLAAFQDRPAIVELILDHTWGATHKQGSQVINQTTSSARTALHLAAERGYRAIVDILLAKGAAVDATTRKGETPLHLAIDSSYVAIAKVLLAKGAAVNVETSQGQTPLHLAAERNLVAIAEVLLAKGANPQAPDHQGQTPLALARSAGHEAMVKTLARLEKKSWRRSCIDCAQACDQDHCPSCPKFSALGFQIDCGCFQNPCSFVCKTLCCIWCYPLEEEAPHPPAEAVPPTPSSSTAAPATMKQPLLVKKGYSADSS